MTKELQELAQDAVYEMRHLSTDTEHCLAQDLQEALDNFHNTVALPVADYGTRPVTPHPLDTLAAVSQFMRTAGQEVKASPGQPTPEVLKLRLAIILEETYELAQAFGMEQTFCSMLADLSKVNSGWEGSYPENLVDTGIYNTIEVLDALADGRYVADGTVLACGLQEAFPEAFANVQVSNMSKFPTTYKDAALTIKKYAQEGISAEFTAPHPWEGCYVVRRTSDQKILKSVGYMPANLGPILKKHSGH